MDIEYLKKANDIKERLEHLKWSRESLVKILDGKDNIALQIYVNQDSCPFVVPAPLGKSITDLLYVLLDEKINELEQQFKEL